MPSNLWYPAEVVFMNGQPAAILYQDGENRFKAHLFHPLLSWSHVGYLVFVGTREQAREEVENSLRDIGWTIPKSS